MPTNIGLKGTTGTTANIQINGVDVVTLDSTGISAGLAAGSVTNTELAAAVIPQFQDFRLTLTSGTPVTTSDVTGATTIYCCPYKGNRIALYDGTRWNIRTSAQFSLALGTLTSGKPYDVFCYDNAGTPTLEFLVWTNDTTRATALTYQDGVLVKTGAATRRYLGTFYTTAATTTEDSEANRYLWNYYHRVSKKLFVTDATATWTYTTATWRQVRASTANQVNYVTGANEDCVIAGANSMAVNAGAIRIASGIGLDSTSSPTASISMVTNGTTDSVGQVSYFEPAGLGRHYLAWLEYSTASGTTTWSNNIAIALPGLYGSIPC